MLTSESCLIILTPEYEPIGEILLEKGSFRGAILDRRGEASIGQRLADWQVTGLETVRHRILAPHREEAGLTEKIRLNDPGFAQALCGWLLEMEFIPLVLSSHALEQWHALLDEEMEPEERYERAVKIAVNPGKSMAKSPKSKVESRKSGRTDHKSTKKREAPKAKFKASTPKNKKSRK